MTFPQTITATQVNKETPIGEMFVDLSWAALLSHNPATTTGLTFGLNGGQMGVDGVQTTVADQTVLLTASSTCYLEVTRAGVASHNTTAFTAGRIPLYTVTTSATGVSSFVDARFWQDLPGVAGRTSVAVTTADVTLSAAQARCDIINVTGALTANRALIVPDGPQTWCVTNNTTGAFTLTVRTAAGTGIAITQGKAADLVADGTNVILSNNDTAAAGGSLLIANNLSDVANAATARTNLGVDAAIAAAVNGLSWKQAVRAATTVAGTLATSFANASVIDGVTLATADRILIKNQAAGAENGIYIVAASGAPARATDADSGAELVNASVYVSEGTTLADSQWTCTTNATITVGTTSLAFAQLTSGGAVATDAIWDVAGDLVYGTGANTAARLAPGTARQKLRMNATAAAPEWVADGQWIVIACSDETTALTAGVAKVTFRIPFAGTLIDVRASVTTAATGATLLTVDLNEAGVTVLSTKLTFDATEKTTTTAATQRVISDSALADDAEMTIDIDAVGNTIAGAGLKVYLLVVPT